MSFAAKQKPRSARGFSAQLEKTPNGDLFFIQTKASNGFDAFYFVLVPSPKVDFFAKLVRRPGGIDFAEYGDVVASGYGRTPHQASKDFIKEKFELDVDALLERAKNG